MANDKFGIILYKDNSTLTSSTKNEGHWWSGSSSRTLNYSFKSTASDTLKLNPYFSEGKYGSSSFTVSLGDWNVSVINGFISCYEVVLQNEDFIMNLIDGFYKSFVILS